MVHEDAVLANSRNEIVLAKPFSWEEYVSEKSSESENLNEQSESASEERDETKILANAEKQKFCQFYAVVKKKDGKWYFFKAYEIEEIESYRVHRCFRPTLLFYRLK